MIGIVAEFNPFHSGHSYLINKSKELLGSNESIVCVMSGDFVQRGEAAIQDKYTRAKNAVLGGADLIIELPLPWCLSSSEYFARGAISLLEAIGCNYLSFGSECGDINEIRKVSSKVINSLDNIKMFMRDNPNYTFPKAKSFVLNEPLLDYPNNSLGVEYLKYAKNFENIVTVKRTTQHDGVGSAKELRLNMNGPNLELPILSRLKMFSIDYINSINGSENGLGNRLYNSIHCSNNLFDIINKTKSKNFTESRIRRLIISSCIGINKDVVKSNPPYCRVLAYNEIGRKLIRQIKNTSPIPVITLPKEIYKLDVEEIIDVFVSGAFAHEFYNLGFDNKDDIYVVNEFKVKPIFVQFD